MAFILSFFKNYFHNTFPSIKALISLNFASVVFLKHLNKTLIAIIPKSRLLETINQYCSICLCNIIYKNLKQRFLLTNFNLYKHTDLIDPLQSSCLPNRGASNNFIQNTLNCSKSKKKKTSLPGRQLQLLCLFLPLLQLGPRRPTRLPTMLLHASSVGPEYSSSHQPMSASCLSTSNLIHPTLLLIRVIARILAFNLSISF